MNALRKIDTSEVDKLITGRVEPHIYAFETNTIPNYLKVGDTYRPVSIRLGEWSTRYKNLKEVFRNTAKVNEEVFFRDYAVHYFLEFIKRKHRLTSDELPPGIYYSPEFFKDASKQDILDAIQDIKESFDNPSGRPYRYFKFEESRIPVLTQYPRTQTFEPRPIQQDTIDRFVEAYNSGRSNLLMFAVMRFGKTFTALCCATEIDANFIVIVSAKADVSTEWQMAVQSHKRFEHYIYLNSRSLLENEQVISQTLKQGKKVALFLTLQDLQGEDIKEKHKDVFNNEIDLLIIDETHYGARAASFGAAISLTRAQLKRELEGLETDDTIEEVNESVKVLDPKVRLHLSGTPYRILMGDEFQKEKDVIAFYQFTDIVEEQRKWDEKYLISDFYEEDEIGGPHKAGEPVQEWHNPYFGFPQMIRFAFNPNESSQKMIKDLKEQGKTTLFSEMFRIRDNKFIHEQEVLDLFQIIDGSKEDENILSFLDYEKIKNGKMCHHIVCVLPYRACCDALIKLLENNRNTFKNLSSYEFVNIAGFERPKEYDDVEAVKARIKQVESQGGKTISLTVNRMLTGNTVPEWDTMIFLKDTASPQEYDQAIFRLQSQYIKEYKDEDNHVIKYNMKPQTLLVDFMPDRMFRLQELKSKIYDVNVDEAGNDKLEERIKKELEISPIICINKNKMVEIDAANVMDEVRKYEETRSVIEEAAAINFDSSLMAIPEIKEVIEKLQAIDAKGGLNFKPATGEGEDMEGEGGNGEGGNGEGGNGEGGNGEGGNGEGGNDEGGNGEGGNGDNEKPEPVNEIAILKKKLATFYSQILFFSFLSENIFTSLRSVINFVETDENDKRIANNLGLTHAFLKQFFDKCNRFILSDLDYTIKSVNQIAHDESMEVNERIERALTKFARLSDSEIVTPIDVADRIVNALPEGVQEGRILDIASKEGEFAIALVKRFGDPIKEKIFAIPTSSTSYEFTRKIFSLLGIPVENVLDEFNSYDIIKTDHKNYETNKQRLKDMNFSTVIGNPPYQLKGGSGGNADAPMYQDFCRMAEELSGQYISLIIPAKWFSAGRKNLLDSFRQEMLRKKTIRYMNVYTNGRDLFSNVEIKGGACYYLIDKEYNGLCSYTLIEKENEQQTSDRNLGALDVLIRDPKISSIVEKVDLKRKSSNLDNVMSIISNDTPFGIPSNPKKSKKNPYDVFDFSNKEHDVKLYHIEDLVRKVEYVRLSDIKKNTQGIDSIKVFITGAGGSGNDSKVMGYPEYAPAHSVCSQSYLYAAFNTELEARNFIKYIYTKFFRVLVASIKITQSGSRDVYRFVPLEKLSNNPDIDWTKDVREIDRQLYAKYGLSNDEIDFIENRITDL